HRTESLHRTSSFPSIAYCGVQKYGPNSTKRKLQLGLRGRMRTVGSNSTKSACRDWFVCILDAVLRDGSHCQHPGGMAVRDCRRRSRTVFRGFLILSTLFSEGRI